MIKKPEKKSPKKSSKLTHSRSLRDVTNPEHTTTNNNTAKPLSILNFLCDVNGTSLPLDADPSLTPRSTNEQQKKPEDKTPVIPIARTSIFSRRNSVSTTFFPHFPQPLPHTDIPQADDSQHPLRLEKYSRVAAEPSSVTTASSEELEDNCCLCIIL